MPLLGARASKYASLSRVSKPRAVTECGSHSNPNYGRTTVIADGGYRRTGLVIPYRRERGQSELPDWKEEHNTSHRQVRAHVEHASAHMKTWKILRDCRLRATASITR